jgi:hypothetical protein
VFVPGLVLGNLEGKQETHNANDERVQPAQLADFAFGRERKQLVDAVMFQNEARGFSANMTLEPDFRRPMVLSCIETEAVGRIK